MRSSKITDQLVVMRGRGCNGTPSMETIHSGLVDQTVNHVRFVGSLASHIRSQLLYRRFHADTLGPSRDLPNSQFEAPADQFPHL